MSRRLRCVLVYVMKFATGQCVINPLMCFRWVCQCTGMKCTGMMCFRWECASNKNSNRWASWGCRCWQWQLCVHSQRDISRQRTFTTRSFLRHARHTDSLLWQPACQGCCYTHRLVTVVIIVLLSYVLCTGIIIIILFVTFSLLLLC